MTDSPAIDLDAAHRIISDLPHIIDTLDIGASDVSAALTLLRQLIPEGADHRRLAGHLASLAGHSMDKALGLC